MNTKKIALMAHLVAGYPDESASLALARGLVLGGASYLEVQIPFSDPSADGPAILQACSQALDAGWNMQKSLDFLKLLYTSFPKVPLFVMSYASPIYTWGVSKLVAEMAKRGVKGLIVPDLPFDADEGLAAACNSAGICAVPVAAPSMRAERMAEMAALKREYLYAALRAGITGTATSLSEQSLAFLNSLARGGSRLLGGFGIRSAELARAVAPKVHAVVAGSVFVDELNAILAGEFKNMEERDREIERAIAQKTAELIQG